ncbi:MAG TPA: hypothetical protein VEZ11_10940, partial [Thermoanaerobaculia bacterium]|nr:hypothetical protein [Thermoanaerobaculia bacterium]
MNPKRKTDLHRMLALAPIPKPPAGLAERIKSDIPNHLRASQAKERERVSQSIVFNLRIAASIVLLISSVYLCIHLLSRMETAEVKEEANLERAERLLGTKPAVPQRAKVQQAPAAEPTKQVAQFSPEPAPQARAQTEPVGGSRQAPVPAPATAAPYSYSGNAPVVVAEADGVATKTQAAPGRMASAAGQPQSAAARTDRDREERETIVVAASAPPPALSKDDNTPRQRAAVEGGVAGGVAAESPRSQAAFDSAKELKRAEPGSVVLDKRVAAAPAAARKAAAVGPVSFFGFQSDAGSLELVKALLRRGERPPAGSIHTDSIVSQFASAVASETSEVRVEVEAAPAPFGSSALVRVSIDTPAPKTPADGPQPIATDASLTIEVDNRAMTARRLNGADPAAAPHVVRTERSILRSTSVT